MWSFVFLTQKHVHIHLYGKDLDQSTAKHSPFKIASAVIWKYRYIKFVSLYL